MSSFAMAQLVHVWRINSYHRYSIYVHTDRDIMQLIWLVSYNKRYPLNNIIRYFRCLLRPIYISLYVVVLQSSDADPDRTNGPILI